MHLWRMPPEEMPADAPDADHDAGTVTRLLLDLNGGNPAALEALFPMVYEELRHIAHRHRARWNGDTTIGTTALVHEAYLKLAGGESVTAQTRLHFLRIASRAMRQILSNYARDRCTQRRGGGLAHLSLERLHDHDAVVLSPDAQCLVLMELNEVLGRLERLDVRLKDVVECRFFGGLSTEETAVALGVSPATVRRDWALARAWLVRELSDPTDAPPR